MLVIVLVIAIVLAIAIEKRLCGTLGDSHFARVLPWLLLYRGLRQLLRLLLRCLHRGQRLHFQPSDPVQESLFNTIAAA